MKKAHKYLLYALIPVAGVFAVYLYNSSGKENPEQIESKAGDQKQKGGERGKGSSRPIPVSVHIAKYEFNTDGLVRLGTIAAKDRVDIASEISGRIVSINFNEGEYVKRGKVLVKLNDDELQTQLKKAEYQYSLQKEKLERQKVLLSKDAVSREDYDQVLTEYNVLRQDIEQLKARIEKTEIRAPFEGVIGFREVSVGAFLQPNTKVTNLVDVRNLVLEFSIPEKYFSEKLIGSVAMFTVEGSIKEFKAPVYAVDPQVDEKTRTLSLRAKYLNASGQLKPGMSARVTLIAGKDGESLYVPNEAVISDVKGRYVWIMKSGEAKMSYLKTGKRTSDKVEVLEGVSAGDTIITTGIMQIRPGSTVVPVNL